MKKLWRWLWEIIFGPPVDYTWTAGWGDWEVINNVTLESPDRLKLRGDGFVMLKIPEAQKWRRYQVTAVLDAQPNNPPKHSSIGIAVLVKDLGRSCGGRYPWLKALDFVFAESWWYRLILRGPTRGDDDWDYNVMNPATTFIENRTGFVGDMTIIIEVDHDEIKFACGRDASIATIRMRRQSKPKAGAIAIGGNHMNVHLKSLKVEEL